MVATFCSLLFKGSCERVCFSSQKVKMWFLRNKFKIISLAPDLLLSTPQLPFGICCMVDSAGHCLNDTFKTNFTPNKFNLNSHCFYSLQGLVKNSDSSLHSRDLDCRNWVLFFFFFLNELGIFILHFCSQLTCNDLSRWKEFFIDFKMKFKRRFLHMMEFLLLF